MREGLADVNPTIGTHIFDEQTRERVLTDDEIAAVWKACRGDHYGSIVKLLILTGQRRLEIGEVVRSEIDFPGRRIRLPGARTKNGQPHDVPLADAALLLVADMLTSHGRELLFGYGDGPFQGWSKCKARLDRDAGIAPWRLHDLRRTVATGMAELGVLPHVVEAVLNHASGHKAGVAGVYNRALYSAEKRNALELWARHVTSLVDLGEPSSGKILQIGGAD
jgi:integrase